MTVYRISHSQLVHLLEIEPTMEYEGDTTGSMLFSKIMDWLNNQSGQSHSPRKSFQPAMPSS